MNVVSSCCAEASAVAIVQRSSAGVCSDCEEHSTLFDEREVDVRRCVEGWFNEMTKRSTEYGVRSSP